jgi:hypothetical protein
MEFKHPQPPSKKKFQSQPSAGKLMLIAYWDSQSPVLEHYMERGTTIISAHYDRPKPAV